MCKSDKIDIYLKKLDEYDNAYYNGESLIEDDSYDVFKEKVYKLLPPDHPRLSKVGHSVSSAWVKRSHDISMGSQNKVSNEGDIRDWVEKVYIALGTSNIEFVLQHKIDGLSLSSVYIEKNINNCITRGNGFIGEDILDNAKLFRQLPTYIDIPNKVVCRGEGVIYKEDFDRIQEQCSNHYKNARNAASGISRRLDGKFSKYIRVIAYDINAKVNKETEKIAVLDKLGFTTVETHVCHTIDEILEYYRDIRDNIRDNLSYGIDGLVLKINDISLQEKLGVKDNRPEGQIALKFDSDKISTSVNKFKLQVGRTGKVTPVAILESVDLMGSTITKASVHNFAYMLELGIGVGAEVVIEKKGDIIPQVTEILLEGDPLEVPKVCPSCGSTLINDGTNLWCKGEVCRERDVNRIVYWVQSIGIKGFSEKFIEKLWDLNKLRNIYDLYKLTLDDFIAVEGIGEKTIKTYFEVIKQTSEMYLETFITALGIPTCSRATADVLASTYSSWDRVKTLVPEDLKKLSGFADVSARSICEGIQEVKSIAEDILRVVKIKEKKVGVLTGLSFCVTGSLFSMSRNEFKALVIEEGGVAKDTVSEGLSYLVTNDKDSGSSKNAKANKLGIKIINEQEFMNMVGKQIQDKKEEKVENKKEITIISESLF